MNVTGEGNGPGVVQVKQVPAQRLALNTPCGRNFASAAAGFEHVLI